MAIRTTTGFSYVPVFLVAGIMLGSVPSLHAQEEKIKIRTEEDFPEGLKEFASPLSGFDRVRSLEAFPPEGDVDGKFFNKPGLQNIRRFGWLTAKRRNIVYYDRQCKDAAGLERQFQLVYQASKHPLKKAYDTDALHFEKFQNHRIAIRKSWLYTGRGHHWRWEEEGPVRPIKHRLFVGACQALGCTAEQLSLCYAWIDLVASDCMPALFFPFELAFRLMS